MEIRSFASAESDMAIGQYLWIEIIPKQLIILYSSKFGIEPWKKIGVNLKFRFLNSFLYVECLKKHPWPKTMYEKSCDVSCKNIKTQIFRETCKKFKGGIFHKYFPSIYFP